MPLYSTQNPPYSISKGSIGSLAGVLLNAETLGGSASKASQQIAIQDSEASPPRPVVLNFLYAAAPSSVQYDIYVSQDDSQGLAGYTKVGSTTNTAGDQVTLVRSGSGAQQFSFVLVKEVVTPNQNATVKVFMA